MWFVGRAANFEFVELGRVTVNGTNGEHFDARHLVSGECTGLIRADNRGTTKGFDGWEGADDRVLLGHSVGTQSQTGCDDSWETFWDSSDGKGNSDFEIVNGTLNERTTMNWIVKVTNVDSPYGDTDNSDKFGELFTEFIEFLGKWSLFSFGFSHGVTDFTDFSVLTSTNDNTKTSTSGDVGTREEKVDFILVNGSKIIDSFSLLWNRDRFTSQESLINTNRG